MKKLTLHINKPIKCLVLAGFFIAYSFAQAGSYEDFFRAIKRDDAAVITLLISRGFDPNAPDPFGQLGLINALEEPSPKVIHALVNSPKIKLNVLNAKGESPLMMAAIKGDLTAAQQMIKKGADVNKTGWTPLHYAASGGHAVVIKLLLDNHAYIDAESPNGTTPLMMASMYGSTEAVQLLLAEGADVSLKNKLGATALQFAKDGERPDAIALLTPAGRSQSTPSARTRQQPALAPSRQPAPQNAPKPKPTGEW